MNFRPNTAKFMSTMEEEKERRDRIIHLIIGEILDNKPKTDYEITSREIGNIAGYYGIHLTQAELNYIMENT